MKEYSVILPFAGALFFNVEADNKEEALEKCYELLDDLPADKDAIREFDGEWDTYERICEGNVCHVSYNKVSVEEN